jgi:hypothetical protein
MIVSPDQASLDRIIKRSELYASGVAESKVMTHLPGMDRQKKIVRLRGKIPLFMLKSKLFGECEKKSDFPLDCNVTYVTISYITSVTF